MADPLLAPPGGSSTKDPLLAIPGGGSSKDPLLAPAAAPKGGSGGILGSIEGAAHVVEHGVQTGAGKVADTTASIGTGIYKIGKDAVAPGTHPSWGQIAHDWNPVSWIHGNNPITGAQAKQDPLAKDVTAIGKQTLTSAVHPGRDPVQTALTALAVLSFGAGTAAKLGYAAKALKVAKIDQTGDLVVHGSDAAKAAEAAGHTVTPLTSAEKTKLILKAASPTTKVPTSARVVNVPKLVAPTVPNDAGRVFVAGKDGTEAVTQAAGPTKLTHVPVELHASNGQIARAVQKVHDAIIQKSLDNGITTARQTRTAKYAEGRVSGATGEAARITRDARAAQVGQVARATANLDQGLPRRLGELASFLRSANVTGKEAADYWGKQATAGVGDRIKVGAGVGQTRTAFLSKLAQQVHDKGLLTLDGKGNVAVDAAKYPLLAKADQTIAAGQATREGILADRSLMTPEGRQKALDVVGQKMLGENARPGQGFVTLRTSRKASPQAAVARTRGNVIPLVKKLPLGKNRTGAGVAKGLIPGSTSSSVARGLSDALRFVNSDELRGNVAKLGSDVKRTGDDILIRDPAIAKGSPELSQQLQEMLGRSESTLSGPSHDTIRAAAKKLLEQHVPGLQDNFEANRAAGLGTRAQEGYKWVPKQLIPDDLTTSVEARGGVEKFADAVNSAVTSATVYLKLGHLPTRFLTNLSTNAVQGSLSPGELKKNVTLANDLTDTQKADLTAVTGTHGYQALPHAGRGTIAKVATTGANLWARKIDAPFRLNAILHELRQRGFDTEPKIDQAITELKNPGAGNMSASQLSQLHAAVRGANRASIMYNGLSAAEKRYVARYVWFYPWTKGAVRFAGHTITEHPAKAAAIGQIGQTGSEYRQQILGNVPGYELGLTPYTEGPNPLSGTLSSFTPFSTTGDVAQALAHPLNKDAGVFGQLNPYYAALATLGAESYAGKKHAVSDALSQAVSPTPEFQAINAYRHPPGPLRMFGVTPLGVKDPRLAAFLGALLRGATGAATPRPVNQGVLNSHAPKG